MTQRNKVIDLMAEHERLTVSQIAQAIGKPATNLYDIQKGKLNGVSEKLADLIIQHFPHYNKSWLLTGEGEMLRDSQSVFGDGNIQIGGNAHNINTGATVDKLVELLKESQQEVKRRGEQIDRLISLLEKNIQ